MTSSGTPRVLPGHRGTTRLLAAVTAVLTGVTGALVVGAPARAETVREGQWHLRELDIAAVHRITKGAGVLVAVVDTGVEASHPDLKGQVRGGTGIGEGAGPAGGSVDVDNHGTSMAGVIAARGGGVNNALGVAPGAKILPVRISTKGPASARDLADGIRWAADHGAKVINISLGDSRKDALGYEVEAVAYALSKDAVVVASSGNRPEGHDIVGVPARIPGVLAVGATTRSGRLWSGSVTGPEVGIAAPGEEIVATGSKRAGSKSGYVVGTGTSPAAAIVSAAAALVRAKFPKLKAPDVINRLIATADDAGRDGRDEEFGFGRLNIKRALTANVPSVTANPLGEPGGASPGPSGGAVAAGDERTNPLTGEAIAGLVILGLVVLGLPLFLIILLIVLLRRRRKRRRALAGPAGMAPPGAGSHPPGGPGGWPPQPQPAAPGGWPVPPPPAPPGGGHPGTAHPYPGHPAPGYPTPPGQPSPGWPAAPGQPGSGYPAAPGYPGGSGPGYPPPGGN